MNKLTEEYGRKGLTVIGLTGEDRKTNLRYMTFNDPSFKYRIALGGGSAYQVRAVPHAFLIAVDGTIAWEGHPGSLPKDDLAKLLKAVEPPEKAEQEERAKMRLAWAEKFASEKLYAVAHHHFEAVKKEFPETEAASKAEKRMEEVAGNEEEFKAQKKVLQLVGGIERPSRKLKSKEGASLSKRLEKMAEDLESNTPRAAELAREWADLLSEPWK